VRDAIRARDLSRLGPLIEQDALAMHAVMHTSTPSLVYWLPGTLDVIRAVRSWRAAEGIQAYFTIDAGPNVHVLCEAPDVEAVTTRLAALPLVESTLSSGPGPAPVNLAEHLF
jgi:diphosphomevalonate decarboxylase